MLVSIAPRWNGPVGCVRPPAGRNYQELQRPDRPPAPAYRLRKAPPAPTWRVLEPAHRHLYDPGETSAHRAAVSAAVQKGPPLPVDYDEPNAWPKLWKPLGLKFAVITSVNATTATMVAPNSSPWSSRHPRPRSRLRRGSPGSRFQGDLGAVATVVDAAPDVFNHNTETVPRLYSPGAPGRPDISARSTCWPPPNGCVRHAD